MTAKPKSHKHHLVRSAHAVRRIAKDHFIPHEGNGHVPLVLKHHVLLGYSAALVLFKALVIAIAIALPSSTVLSSAITPHNVIDLTNRTREGSRLNSLKENQKLAKAAQAKAQDMLDRNYFSHFGPDGSTPWSWIVKSGYAYNAAAENLAINFVEAEDVESSWLASPSHRLNLLNPKYSEIGVGVSSGMFHGKPAIVVVQMFGQPKTEGKTAVQSAASATLKTFSKNLAVKSGKTIEEKTNGRVAGIATVDTARTKPTIDLSGADINLLEGSVEIEVPIKQASLVNARLGQTETELSPSDETDVWKGTISLDETPNKPEGEKLTVTAIGANGQKSDTAFALIVPNADARDIYALGTDDGADCPLLRGSLQGIGKSSRCVYSFTILFLCISLGIFMLLGKMKRPIHIAHAALVIALAMMLLNF